jgi:hypothetical protein
MVLFQKLKDIDTNFFLDDSTNPPIHKLNKGKKEVKKQIRVGKI